jgi:site-specific DNA-methyltransferase (adenine-specific)
MGKNLLYCGDNLEVLRRHIDSESVDLTYLDPPFNSKRDYNIFFDGKESQTQRIAFEDTWSYKNIQESFSELRTLQTHNLFTLLDAYRVVIPSAFPYLVMMTLRLIELHRVLKPTGSFYLHCDATMGHYLKTICDAIFGEKNFRSHIMWKRTSSHNDAKRRYADLSDAILFYTKTDKYTFHVQYADYSDDYIKKFYRYIDKDGRRYTIDNLRSPNPRPNLTYEYKGYKPHANGWAVSREVMERLDAEGRLAFPKSKEGRIRLKRYLDEMPGIPIGNVWTDIKPVQSQAAERLRYPTQKPKALLERIIQTSSNEGDVILDAFCGCGTSIDAAEGLHRRWIGIDISPVAISLIKRRIVDTYKIHHAAFEILGIPTDEPTAIKLWQENAFAFQDWWLMEYEVFSTTYGTKGADKGVDGLGLFAEMTGETARVGFQVKGGKNISSKDVDALLGAMQKFKCELGVFMSINNPTQPMMETVSSMNFIELGHRQRVCDHLCKWP